MSGIEEPCTEQMHNCYCRDGYVCTCCREQHCECYCECGNNECPCGKVPHANHPHLLGTLYDCPACESECFCDDESTKCVYCDITSEEF